MVKWTRRNDKHYKNKGYPFTKYGDEFYVKVEDLTSGSTILVNVQCDGCGEILKNMKWYSYKKCVKEDGKYYCHKCAINLFGIENKYKSQLKNGKSFEQYCIERDRQDLLEKWDYELNKCKPSEITYGVNKNKYYFKCSRNLHDSELKSPYRLITYNIYNTCNKCNSFEQWCIDNNRQDVLNRWDYELNNCKPDEVSYGSSRRKYYFKCPRGLHDSELKLIKSFTMRQKRSINCKQCNSFAQWGIDNLGEDFLDKYWDYEKNNELGIDPWLINKKCYIPKIYIKCQENLSHKSYLISPSNFCTNRRCPICNLSKGEIKINNYLVNKRFISILENDFNILIDINKYNKNYFIPQKEYDGLVGLKGGLLSYDFYIPKYNLIIEYQGIQHEKYIPGFHESYDDFLKQVEHDRRKREYAKNNNINLLEIWYYDFDNIEEILEKELEVINIGK